MIEIKKKKCFKGIQIIHIITKNYNEMECKDLYLLQNFTLNIKTYKILYNNNFIMNI